MIRVVRPVTEPPALKTNRDRLLPKLQQHIATNGSFDPDQIEGYECARSELFTAQHHKCCYCEREQLEIYQAVEHYRPKSVYWWLAWTWSNLLFVCQICNRQKSNYFPLLSGVQLTAEQQPPGGECPAILDPTDLSPGADPLAHIIFRKEPRGWVPYARNGSDRGRLTIEYCGLNRPELLDRYRTHERQFADALQRVMDALDGGKQTDIQSTWFDVTIRWLSPSMPLTALTRDILDSHVPPDVRQRYGLSLDLTPPWTL